METSGLSIAMAASDAWARQPKRGAACHRVDGLYKKRRSNPSVTSRYSVLVGRGFPGFKLTPTDAVSGVQQQALASFHVPISVPIDANAMWW